MVNFRHLVFCLFVCILITFQQAALYVRVINAFSSQSFRPNQTDSPRNTVG